MTKPVEFQIKIKGDDGFLKELTVEANNAGEALENIVESATKAQDKLSKFADVSIILDTTTRALNNLSGLVAPFNSFETAMKKANTMANKSGEDFDKLNKNIVGLSKNIPLVREELAEGLYQTISNGVPEDNWISFLEQSSKASVGGVADLGQTVTVTSTLIKNYGLAWDAAGLIQDKIQTTAKNGVTSFEQLGQALPRVSGSAAQLGVEMDELMAVFATTTGVTGNTSEVSTQLAAVLNSLIKPSSEASKAAEAMGIRFDAASIKAAGGFQNFLTQLDESVKEYAASTGELSESIYGKLFGSAEALRLLGSLTGEQKDKYVQNVHAMADSAGAIDDAFAEMTETGEAASQMFRNKIAAITDWAAAMVSGIAPYVTFIAETGTATTSIVQLVTSMNAVIPAIRSFDYAAKLAAIQAHAVAIASKAWSSIQIVLNAVLTANPIGIVVAAVAALVAIVVVAYRNSESFRRICDALWSSIKKLATAVWDYLVKAFERASNVIKKAWEWVQKFFGISPSSTQTVTDALNEQADAVDRLVDSSANLNNAPGIKLAPLGTPDSNKDSNNKKAAPEGSLKWLSEKIESLKAKIDIEIDDVSRNKLAKELSALETKQHIIQMQLKLQAEKPIENTRKLLEESLTKLGKGKSPLIDKPKDLKIIDINNTDNPLDQKAKELKKFNEQMSTAANATGALSSIFNRLGSSIDGATGAWLGYVGSFMGNISQVIKACVALAGAKSMISAAETPFIGWLNVGAAVAAVIAGFASLPKFADGGIAYGPTVGIFGEYAGARTNPEVVAPLNKLKSLISDSGNDSSGGVVEFKIKENTLVGFLNRSNRRKNRT